VGDSSSWVEKLALAVILAAIDDALYGSPSIRTPARAWLRGDAGLTFWLDVLGCRPEVLRQALADLERDTEADTAA
jgi:hypothetical protein